jgi:ketosteroid isomerase-like protein
MMERISTVPRWIEDFYGAVDANDGPGALAQMTPDVRLRFTSRPPAQGREAAAATLGDFHRGFVRVSHQIHHVWNDGRTFICEFTATYTLHDGGQLALPSMTVLERDHGAIAGMRVYLDEGPLALRAD